MSKKKSAASPIVDKSKAVNVTTEFVIEPMLIYSPHGMVIDIDNPEMVKDFIQVQEILKSGGRIFIKSNLNENEVSPLPIWYKEGYLAGRHSLLYAPPSSEINSVLGWSEHSEKKITKNNEDIKKSNDDLSDFFIEQIHDLQKQNLKTVSALEKLEEEHGQLKELLFNTITNSENVTNQLIPINMYLDTDNNDDIYRSYQAVLDFLDVIEFKILVDFPSKTGSWLKQWISRSTRAMTSEEVISRLKEAEYGVEVNAILKPQSEVEKNQSEALVNIIKSVENIRHAAIRIGSLLVVKVTTPEGEANIQVRTLSIQELHLVNKHPELLNQPAQILAALNRMLKMNESENKIKNIEDNFPDPPHTLIE